MLLTALFHISGEKTWESASNFTVELGEDNAMPTL